MEWKSFAVIAFHYNHVRYNHYLLYIENSVSLLVWALLTTGHYISRTHREEVIS